MSKYFDKIPVVSYDGQIAKNLLARARFSENTKNDPSSFIPYRLENSVTRPDLIANAYYEESYYDWIYYYSNSIVDPYHDTFKEDLQFQEFIKTKYGSTEQARDTILYYRNNWSQDTTEVSLSAYSNLASNLKKYYEPTLDYFGNVIKYTRKKVDWTVSTNQIRSLTVDTINDYVFVGDIFIQEYNNFYIAIATLVNIDRDNSILTFDKITGTFVSSTGNIIFGKYGSLGKSTVTAINNPSNADNIPDSEKSYWDAVSAYDHENEINEQKRNIFLLRNSLKSDADAQLTKLMRT
jgi:hypothetical protein